MQRYFTPTGRAQDQAAALAAPTASIVINNGSTPPTAVNILHNGNVVASRQVALDNTAGRQPWTAADLAQVATPGMPVISINSNANELGHWFVTY